MDNRTNSVIAKYSKNSKKTSRYFYIFSLSRNRDATVSEKKRNTKKKKEERREKKKERRNTKKKKKDEQNKYIIYWKIHSMDKFICTKGYKYRK